MGDTSPQRLSDGRYEVRQLIGRGGMAEVHLGYDTRLSRPVAIKMLRTDLARDAIFLARFRREAQAAASLNHPNIVAVYDTGERTVIVPDGSTVNVPYIVMEYVEGHTVHELLTDGQPVPIKEAIDIIEGVLHALEFSHRHGLIHRDIKPGNVMLTMSGEVKVMDFGIARAMEDSGATMTQTDAVVGTAQYLSPEQARGEQVDTRSDLYSAGCMLFELLTGRPPFRGDSAVAVAYQHVSEEPPLPSSITPDISSELDRVLMKALAKRPVDRYQDAASMCRDLEAASRGATVDAPEIAHWAQPQPSHGRGGDTRSTMLLNEVRKQDSAPPLTLDRPSREAARERLAREEAERDRKRRNRTWGVIIGLVVVALVAVAGVLAYNRFVDNTPERQRIPEAIIGQSLEQARAQLSELGFTVREGEPVASNSVEANLVAETDPAAGTEVAYGSTVTLRPSSGPAQVAMPDLIGQTQDQARKSLEALKVSVGNVTQEDAPGKDAGTVIRTSPSAGTQLNEGDQVSLVLASGYVSIDSSRIVGKSQEEATEYLNGLGMTVNSSTRQTADAEPGTVVSVSPTGHQKAGSRVEIVVAEQPPTPTAPEPSTSSSAPSRGGGTTGDTNS